MDAGEAEGIGREYLERWPRDRVIFGSLYPYRLPSQPGSLAPCVGWDSGNPRSHLTLLLLISNDGLRSALFGPVLHSKPSPVAVGHCAGIIAFCSTVEYSMATRTTAKEKGKI